jgi:hypothetical protein
MKPGILAAAVGASLVLTSAAQAVELKISHVRPQGATIDVEVKVLAAADFEEKRWKTAEADQGKNEQKLADLGAKVVQLSADELAASAKKVRAEVWPEILKDVGEDWGNAILKKAQE